MAGRSGLSSIGRGIPAASIDWRSLLSGKTKAGDAKVVLSGSAWSPDFIQELLPAAERTALLYHVSYLCLAGFPTLERLLRSRALETQLLFGSSEALLFKCIGTSENLVKSLFPMLKIAVEKNKPTLAVKYLEKAKAWITKIITEVEQIVERYNSHNRDIATTTSDVITEKTETDKKIESQTKEAEIAETTVEKYKKDLQQVTAELADKEKEINDKNSELEELVRAISKRSTGLGILSAMVPFLGAIISSIVQAAKNPGDKARIQALQNKINLLVSDKTALKQREYTLQNEVFSWQMQAAKAKMELGSIPSPEHLDEVQTCLSRIQQILVQLQKFWEKIGAMLDYLKDKTFVGEDMIDDLDILKDVFLESITTAGEVWTKFGAVCAKANGIFSVQARDAYSFLEINPSSLSKEEWQSQYDAVKEKLELINPSPPAIEGTGTEEPPASAITQ
ncbi:uncharacterized protein LOC115821788 [Chanos chanos]|uniref:Uncharacterized protein LOC115821788 n=1 Tax=Chanos chanos TaxID=29144 RepID=A0A6J2WAN4_CHACN|nr:uncharacterized protein LOC115821788 [Chanos chanos]